MQAGSKGELGVSERFRAWCEKHAKQLMLDVDRLWTPARIGRLVKHVHTLFFRHFVFGPDLCRYAVYSSSIGTLASRECIYMLL